MKIYSGEFISWLEPKYDGYNITLTKDKNGIYSATTRIKSIDFIADLLWLKRDTLPNDTIIVGELYADNVPATAIRSLINNQSKLLKFIPYHVDRVAGIQPDWKSFKERNAFFRNHNFEEIKCYPLNKALTKDDIQMLLETAAAQKLEGWIAKQSLNSWLKLKVIRTVDAIITAIELSESISYGGSLKSITVSVSKNGRLVSLGAVGTGFTKEFKLTTDPQTLIGKVCEIKYDCLAAQGKLQRPRFVRWRDDKLPEQCLYEQVY